MGISDIFRRASAAEIKLPLDEASKDVSVNYDIAKLTPDDCHDCSNCYPNSLKIEDGPLFQSAKKAFGQVLVATGQSNWTKDIGEEPTNWGSVCQKLSEAADQFAEHAGGPVRINGTSCDFEDAEAAGKVSVIVLPQFIRILTDAKHCVRDVEAVFKVRPGDTLQDNMIPLNDRGYIILCSHRQRDKRCGITAPILKKALDVELRKEGLYRDPDDTDAGGVRVIFCNHVGGHKFAANALIYQNNGMALMLARLRPEHSKALIHNTILNNAVDPEYVRFSNKLSAYGW